MSPTLTALLMASSTAEVNATSSWQVAQRQPLFLFVQMLLLQLL